MINSKLYKNSAALFSFICLTFSGAVANAQQGIAQSALDQIEILMNEKASRTQVEEKIDSQLLMGLKLRKRDPAVRSLSPEFIRLNADADNLIDVSIQTQVTGYLLQRIKDSGGVIVNQFPEYQSIRAKLPIDKIETIAALADVKHIREFIKPITRMINTSQGDVAHAANVARTMYGATGTGIRIGVISDSVDALATLQGSGDLPAGVTVVPGQSGNPDSSEGTAMLEIVHDLAPNAQLFFATGFAGEASMANNIRTLRNTFNADIIVDDVGYPLDPVFQDGILAQAVEEVVANGALYFSAAGNAGNKNDGTSGVWEGNFVATTLPGVIPPDVTSGQAHRFGTSNFNRITADTGLITLKWADAIGASANDYDLCLLNAALTQVISCSTNTQNGNDDPVEFIDTEATDVTGFAIVVIKASGADRFLHLNTNRGALAVSTAGQTYGQPAAENAFGVAAVNVAAAGGGTFNGGAANPVENFSSDGPRRIFFDANGVPLTPGNFSATGGVVRQKPDIAAADGVATATPGFNPFFGTSAAAPHAAAITALMLSSNPGLNLASVKTRFRHGSKDIEAPGMDRDSGYGVIRADILACPAMFNDVLCGPTPADTAFAFTFIRGFANAGITGGCGAGNYCPDDSVTREQMAVFLEKSRNGAAFMPPPASGDFTDVPVSSPFAAWIEQLADDGITGGCGPNIYCPQGIVNREQMAVFILKAVNGAGFTPPPATGNFNDVPVSSPFAAWIEQLATSGITGGCGGGNYCPNNPVTRAQMAVFLVKAFNFPM